MSSILMTTVFYKTVISQVESWKLKGVMSLLEDDLSALLSIGQVSYKSYLPSKKIY